MPAKDKIKVLDELTLATLNPDGKAPRVLIFDIETAPSSGMYFDRWREGNILTTTQDWYMLCFAYKWLGEKQVHAVSLMDKGFNPKKPDDWWVIERLWHLFNEADYVIAHNGDCVRIDTMILKQDLTWVKAGDLKEGDDIVGFEETSSTKWGARKVIPSKVISNRIESRPGIKVTFDNGDEIVTTVNHPWLKLAANGREYRWCESQNLKVGQRVERFLKPWKDDTSYEAGWLSGFIAGEGTLKQSGPAFSIDFCQRPGVTLNRALEFCKKLNIELAPLKTKIGGLGRGDTQYTYMHGGKWRALEILGKLRIDRLINNIAWERFGSLKSHTLDTATIVAVEHVGLCKMAILTTSSQTYFAGGYPMHNSFDIKKSNARFAVHGLPPPSPIISIDTKKIAKKYFAFESNKLDELGRQLGLGRKEKTGGFDLWLECMAGDKKAWSKMVKYNKQDVLLLEQVYLKLRGWHVTHPNVSFLSRKQGVCPTCQSTEYKRDGMRYTRQGASVRYECKNCHRHYTGPVIHYDKVRTY